MISPNTSDSTNSSSTEELVYERLAIEESYEYPFMKRVKTRLLSFLRDHYLKIFIFLLFFILILVSALAVLAIFRPPASVASTVRETVTDKTYFSTDDYLPYAYSRLVCSKVSCNYKSPCILDDLSYREVRQYSCCKCLPTGYRLIRYEFSTYPAMVIQINRDVKSMSDLDISTLPQLPYLKGSWSKVQESESTYYLRFNDVRVDAPDSDEDSDESHDPSEGQ